MDELLYALRGLALPLAYDHFAEKETPAPPFLIYRIPGSNNFFADNTVYQKVERVYVELYTDLKAPSAERSLEAAITSWPWEKTETYIDTEKLYQIIYEIEV